MTIDAPYTVIKIVVDWKARMLKTVPQVTSETKENIIDELFLLPFGLLLCLRFIYFNSSRYLINSISV